MTGPSSPHRVVALVASPRSIYEASCAAEVFGMAATATARRYDFATCVGAEDAGRVAACSCTPEGPSNRRAVLVGLLALCAGALDVRR